MMVSLVYVNKHSFLYKPLLNYLLTFKNTINIFSALAMELFRHYVTRLQKSPFFNLEICLAGKVRIKTYIPTGPFLYPRLTYLFVFIYRDVQFLLSAEVTRSGNNSRIYRESHGTLEKWEVPIFPST